MQTYYVTAGDVICTTHYDCECRGRYYTTVTRRPQRTGNPYVMVRAESAREAARLASAEDHLIYASGRSTGRRGRIGEGSSERTSTGIPRSEIRD